LKYIFRNLCIDTQPNQKQPTKMSLIQNQEQTFRWGRVQYLMEKTTDKQLLLSLMGGRGTYCCYEYYWTRSKQKAFTDWLEYMEKCIEMANDEDDGNWVEPTEFEEFTYHGTTFWKNTDGKCQWFYEYNNGEVGDELGIYTSDDDLEFSDGEGKNAGDYVPVLYWGRLVGENLVLHGKGFGYNTKFGVHPVAKLIKPTEFEEFTYYGTKFWKNTDGKGQWFYEYNNGEVGDELGIYTSDRELEFTEEGKNAGDYVPVLHWCGVIGEKMFLTDNLHPVAKLIKRFPIRPVIATADSPAHEIMNGKYIVFGNFFTREQFAQEAPAGASDYFDEFKEHIHRLGRQGHFNELMKEYFEEWLETNQ
jgi:hypothetical protein